MGAGHHLRVVCRPEYPDGLNFPQLFVAAAVSSIVILLGAELNSEIEHQTSRDSTIGNDMPFGARGAVKLTQLERHKFS